MRLPDLKPGFYAVFLENFRVQMTIGVLEHEKTPQTVSFSIGAILRRIGPGDGIEDVVDYNHLRETVLDLTSGRGYGLQETLCEEIIERLKRHRNVHGVVIETRKLCAYDDADAVGCRLSDIDPEALL